MYLVAQIGRWLGYLAFRQSLLREKIRELSTNLMRQGLTSCCRMVMKCSLLLEVVLPHLLLLLLVAVVVKKMGFTPDDTLLLLLLVVVRQDKKLHKEHFTLLVLI